MSVGHNIEQYLRDEHAMVRVPVRGFSSWDARIKLTLALIAVVLNTWLALPWLSAATLVVGVVLLSWTNVPWRRQAAFLLIPLWSTLILLLGFAAGFGVTPLMKVGPVTFYAEGLIRGGQVALRAYCDIVWLMSCVLTTPFAKIMQALRWYRVPDVIVDTLSMMYRYAFVLFAEFRRLRLAAQSRGGAKGYVAEMHLLARISAQIFLRAFDRSERIYWAMVARGGGQYE
ncbi:MAG: cobalt ECF transporter T component CbiQ [Armatimonadota bacterium]